MLLPIIFFGVAVTYIVRKGLIFSIMDWEISVDEVSCASSINNIFSAGDCATIKNIITNENSYVPLATGANKLGRIVGENLAGAKKEFPGTLGASCLKLLSLEAGRVGLSEEEFINYLDFEIGKYDPNVYVYVGDKSVNYDKLDKRIKTIYNSKIYKGIKIVYKNILYDFSLS